MGSASELEYLLLLSKDLEYIHPDECQTIEAKLIAAKKMLNTFLQKVRNRVPNKH